MTRINKGGRPKMDASKIKIECTLNNISDKKIYGVLEQVKANGHNVNDIVKNALLMYIAKCEDGEILEPRFRDIIEQNYNPIIKEQVIIQKEEQKEQQEEEEEQEQEEEIEIDNSSIEEDIEGGFNFFFKDQL